MMSKCVSAAFVIIGCLFVVDCSSFVSTRAVGKTSHGLALQEQHTEEYPHELQSPPKGIYGQRMEGNFDGDHGSTGARIAGYKEPPPQIPYTGFNCSSQKWPGYYADPAAGCHSFYICQEGGRQDGFMCPEMTLFNEELMVCDWAYKVNCSLATSFYYLNEHLYDGQKGCHHTVPENVPYDQGVPDTEVPPKKVNVEGVDNKEVPVKVEAGEVPPKEMRRMGNKWLSENPQLRY